MIGKYVTNIIASALFKGFFDSFQELATAEKVGTVTGPSIKSQLKKIGVPSHKIEITDMSYKQYELNTLKTALQFNLFRHLKYYSDNFDCEKYAYSLYALIKNILRDSTIGTIYVNRPIEGTTLMEGHALNFFFTKENEILLIEPQTNEMFEMPSDWQARYANI